MPRKREGASIPRRMPWDEEFGVHLSLSTQEGRERQLLGEVARVQEQLALIHPETTLADTLRLLVGLAALGLPPCDPAEVGRQVAESSLRLKQQAARAWKPGADQPARESGEARPRTRPEPKQRSFYLSLRFFAVVALVQVKLRCRNRSAATYRTLSYGLERWRAQDRAVQQFQQAYQQAFETYSA